MITNLRIRSAVWIATQAIVLTIGLITLFANGVTAQTNTFPASGNAGVGTPAPTYKLQVNGSGDATGNSVLVTDSNTLTTHNRKRD